MEKCLNTLLSGIPKELQSMQLNYSSNYTIKMIFDLESNMMKELYKA